MTKRTVLAAQKLDSNRVVELASDEMQCGVREPGNDADRRECPGSIAISQRIAQREIDECGAENHSQVRDDQASIARNGVALQKVEEWPGRKQDWVPDANSRLV